MGSMIIAGVLIGLIATALSDLWAVFLEKAFKVPNYGFDVAAGSATWRAGSSHKPIFASQPIPGEKIIGWIAHYALGAAFGFLPILLGGGAGWIANPTWLAAIGAGCSRSQCPSSSWFPRSAWACSVRARRIRRRAARA